MRFIVVLASNSIADTATSVAHALANSSRVVSSASSPPPAAASPASARASRHPRSMLSRSVATSPGVVISRVMAFTREISRESAVSASSPSTSN